MLPSDRNSARSGDRDRPSLRALGRDAVRDTRGCITGCGPEPIFSCRGNPEPIGKVS